MVIAINVILMIFFMGGFFDFGLGLGLGFRSCLGLKGVINGHGWIGF